MLIKRWKQKRNNKKAAAVLRRLLSADEKDLPERVDIDCSKLEQPLKVINIMGIPYEVIEVDQISKEQMLAGEIDFIHQIIRLDKGLSSETKGQTLMHEIMHGVCQGLGLYELGGSECAIQSIASALYQIFHEHFIFSFETVSETEH